MHNYNNIITQSHNHKNKSFYVETQFGRNHGMIGVQSGKNFPTGIKECTSSTTTNGSTTTTQQWKLITTEKITSYRRRRRALEDEPMWSSSNGSLLESTIKLYQSFFLFLKVAQPLVRLGNKTYPSPSWDIPNHRFPIKTWFRPPDFCSARTYKHTTDTDMLDVQKFIPKLARKILHKLVYLWYIGGNPVSLILYGNSWKLLLCESCWSLELPKLLRHMRHMDGARHTLGYPPHRREPTQHLNGNILKCNNLANLRHNTLHKFILSNYKRNTTLRWMDMCGLSRMDGEEEF